MTDKTHAPEENLAFLRQLATAGKDAPLMAGPYLIASGGWFGAASLLQWPPIREWLGLGFGQAMRRSVRPPICGAGAGSL